MHSSDGFIIPVYKKAGTRLKNNETTRANVNTDDDFEERNNLLEGEHVKNAVKVLNTNLKIHIKNVKKGRRGEWIVPIQHIV